MFSRRETLQAVALAVAVATAFPGQAPGSERLVFGSSRTPDGDYSDLYSVSLDGTDLRQLTATPDFLECCSSATRDGRMVAFLRASKRDVRPVFNEVFTIMPDGRGERQVTHTPGIDIGEPALSPDGTRVVYPLYDANGRSDLYVINVDGSGERRLTETPALEETPNWSPDGTKIVYAAETPDVADGTDMSIWVLDLASGSTRKLTEGGWYDYNRPISSTWHYYPTWCAGTDRIAYVQGVEIRPGFWDSDLYSIDAAGGGIQQVTHGPDRDMDPTCSPDGTRVAFGRMSARATPVTSQGIHVVNLQTGQVTQVTSPATPSGGDWEPTWVTDFKVAETVVPLLSSPVPASREASVPAGRAIIVGSRALVSRDGRVRILLRCRSARACVGSVELRAHGRRVSRAAYWLTPSSDRRLTLRLSGPARRVLTRRGRLIVRVRGTGPTALAPRRLTLIRD